MSVEWPGTVIIGGSQSGLAAGYHLRRRGLPFLILDENDRVGDAWRQRWDSLRLFTPARYNGLPGRRFPGRGSRYPGKDDVADYLEAYARELELPVRTGVRVDRLARIGEAFELSCGEETIRAHNVIVATGAYHTERVPPFADELDPDIRQLHSKRYRNPGQVMPGPVLVVGAGNSGAEIALELSRRHPTWISGRDTGQEPTRGGGLADRLLVPLLWLVAHRILTVGTPLGRKVRDHFLDPPRGIPLGRVRRKDLEQAGVRRVSRVTGVRGGLPALEDGTVVAPATVVWCTGFRPGYGWIDIPLPVERGYPAHRRGVVDWCPGLFFLGLPFLYSPSSALVGGVGRDAAHVVRQIVLRRAPPGWD